MDTGLVPGTLSLRPLLHSQAEQELGPPRAEVLTGAVDHVHGTPRTLQGAFSGESWALVGVDRMVGRAMSLGSNEWSM